MKNFCEDLFSFFPLESTRAYVLGLEHSCPWPQEGLSSEGLFLALASDFFCVLGLGLEPCVLDSTTDDYRTGKEGSTVRYVQNSRTMYLAPSTVPYQRTVLQFNF